MITRCSLVVALTLASCSAPSSSPIGDVDNAIVTEVRIPTIDNEAVYVSFVINSHDWVSRVDESQTSTLNTVDTLSKLVQMHEAAHLPVDIYVTDPIVQALVREAPSLVAAIKTSEYVAIDYLVRAPSPHYRNANNDGYYGDSWHPTFNALRTGGDDAGLYKLLWAYEHYETDLTTGSVKSNQGGYSFVTSTFGYAPYTVTGASSDDSVGIQLGTLFQDMGAAFVVTHAGSTTWGQRSPSGLAYRPETTEIKLHKDVSGSSESADYGSKFIEEAHANIGTTRPAFVNFKIHDDDFTIRGTPWDCIYYTADASGEPGCWGNEAALSPKYDLSRKYVLRRTATEKSNLWQRYQYLLDYFSSPANRVRYKVVSGRELRALKTLDTHP